MCPSIQTTLKPIFLRFVEGFDICITEKETYLTGEK